MIRPNVPDFLPTNQERVNLGAFATTTGQPSPGARMSGVKRGMAGMLKGGVVMDVVTAPMTMRLGAERVSVGPGVLKSGKPTECQEAIVKATTFYDDPDLVAKVSRGLGEAMVGINGYEIPQPHRLSERGW